MKKRLSTILNLKRKEVKKMKSYSKVSLVLVIAMVLSMVAMAQAVPVTITFDPTGTPGATGDISNVGLLDWAPGNALAVGGNPTATGLFTGANVTLLYQANLSTAQDPSTAGLFLNGAGGDFFTAVAGFNEVASVSGATATFTQGAGPSFFDVYATSALGNNLTGLGFTTGTLIMHGTLSSIQTSNFTVTSVTPVQFDQSPNGNQWGTETAIVGGGATNITALIDFVDPNYFPSLDPGVILTFSFFNTSTIVPYNQVDPSRAMSSNGTANGDVAANIGAVDGGFGSGPNFLFQADANQSFSVPEPGTIILLGAGLFGIGIFGRKKMKK